MFKAIKKTGLKVIASVLAVAIGWLVLYQELKCAEIPSGS